MDFLGLQVLPHAHKADDSIATQANPLLLCEKSLLPCPPSSTAYIKAYCTWIRGDTWRQKDIRHIGTDLGHDHG